MGLQKSWTRLSDWTTTKQNLHSTLVYSLTEVVSTIIFICVIIGVMSGISPPRLNVSLKAGTLSILLIYLFKNFFGCASWPVGSSTLDQGLNPFLYIGSKESTRDHQGSPVCACFSQSYDPLLKTMSGTLLFFFLNVLDGKAQSVCDYLEVTR